MPNHKMDIRKNSPPHRALTSQTKVGFPSKLTPEMQAKFCELLMKGNFVETVCKACGVHYTTWRDWIRKGERGIEPYASFYNAVHEAIAKGEMYHVEIMHDAATEDWRASEKFLRMRHGDRWNRQEMDIRHTLSKVGDEQLHEAISEGENALLEMEERIMKAIEGISGEVVDGEVVDEEG